MAVKPQQPVSEHGASSHAETNMCYSMYVTGEVLSLQDQADNGGWTLQNMPVCGDSPILDTRMGTRGSFKQATDYFDTPTGIVGSMGDDGDSDD